MKKLFALLLTLCLLFGAFAFAEEPAAETPAAETEVAAEETDAETPAEETAQSSSMILGNGWVTTAEEVMEITEPLNWMADKESMAFLSIMLLMDAYETEGFEIEDAKYFPQNAYVGVTLENKNIVLYPSLKDNTVLQLVYDMETQQVSGSVATMESTPDDTLMTAIMTQLCGVNVNKTDADTVTYILNVFTEASGK